MKLPARLILCLPALALNPGFGQPSSQASPSVSVAEATLTKFDLDFPGGTPNDLVAAIGKATGRPLNAIVPEEWNDTKQPPLKMNQVDVSQLFAALQNASSRVEFYTYRMNGGTSSGRNDVRFGFMTTGKASDDSVWYFTGSKNPPPPGEPKQFGFYLLTPYLDRGLTVDDITTAIQTAWKMLGDSETPTISFHKETKLLIAVGDPFDLDVIREVLKALEVPKEKSPARAPKSTSP